MEKTLVYYKRLPYTLRLEPQTDLDGTHYWTAEYVELRGCKTEGGDEAEAIANLQQLFDEYISTKIENQFEIIEPIPQKAEVIKEITVYWRKRTVARTTSERTSAQTKFFKDQRPVEKVVVNMPKTEETKSAALPDYEEIEIAV